MSELDKAKKLMKEQAKLVFEEYRPAIEELKSDTDSSKAELDERIAKMDSRLNEIVKDLDETNVKLKQTSFTHGSDKEDRLEKEYSNLFRNKLSKSKNPLLTTEEGVLIKEYEDAFFKAINAGTDNQGGHLIPTGDATSIMEQVEVKVPLFGLANTVTSGLAQHPFLVQTTKGSVTIGDEATEVTNTGTPLVEEVRIQTYHFEAEPWTTIEVIEDAQINVSAFVQEEAADIIADKLGVAFTTGNGTNQPLGLVATEALDASSTFDKIKTIAAANAHQSAAQDGFDVVDLYTMIYDLNARYRLAGSTAMLMGDEAFSNLRKLQTSDGLFIWQPNVAAGQPATFDDHKVMFMPNMPALSGGGDPAVIFGNFKKGYAIVNRPDGNRVIVDELTNKKYVKFYTKKRVGGGLLDARALRVLKSKT